MRKKRPVKHHPKTVALTGIVPSDSNFEFARLEYLAEKMDIPLSEFVPDDVAPEDAREYLLSTISPKVLNLSKYKIDTHGKTDKEIIREAKMKKLNKK